MHDKIRSVLAGIVLLMLATAGHAGDWRNAWESEKHAAAQRCAKTFADYQLQAVCMNNEKRGYDKMQGDFGLASVRP